MKIVGPNSQKTERGDWDDTGNWGFQRIWGWNNCTN
jgi:hypothetical protein